MMLNRTNPRWSVLAAATMFASCAAAALAAPAEVAKADLAKMVQTEYDFSAMADREGYKASFLKYLADDSILFADNRLLNGKERVRSRPDLPGKLQWYPDYAVVSSAGDVGLSTGPWVFTTKDGKPGGYGHFFSIWRKQADGTWLNAVDIGISHDEIKPAPTPLKVAAPTGHTQSPSSKSKDRSTDVRAAEAEFARLASASGHVAAVEQMAHRELRVYREGHAPVVGVVQSVAFLKQQNAVGPTKLNATGGTGDFGYAYGMVEKPAGDGSSHAFVHVWQQVGGRWRLLAELFTPVAQPQQ